MVFFWLNSLTAIGSEIWEPHLEGISPAFELSVCASPFLCLLTGILTVAGRVPARYGAVALGLFIFLGFTILRLWYVPFNPEMKRSVLQRRAADFAEPVSTYERSLRH